MLASLRLPADQETRFSLGLCRNNQMKHGIKEDINTWVIDKGAGAVFVFKKLVTLFLMFISPFLVFRPF